MNLNNLQDNNGKLSPCKHVQPPLQAYCKNVSAFELSVRPYLRSFQQISASAKEFR